MYDAKEGGKDQVVAVNADTLVSTTVWGADPATSALVESWPLAEDRRSAIEHRQVG